MFNVDHDNVGKKRHESGESVEKKHKDTKDVDVPNDSITLQTYLAAY